MQSCAFLESTPEREWWVGQPGHWQVNPHVQPEPASVVKVLKGGTTGAGPGISGNSRGGRSSTGVGLDVGDVPISEGW